MLLLTFAYFFYGVLINFELYNKLPEEVCKNNTYMSEKTCVSFITGTRGAWLLSTITMINLYFSYVHYLYCLQLTVVLS